VTALIPYKNLAYPAATGDRSESPTDSSYAGSSFGSYFWSNDEDGALSQQGTIGNPRSRGCKELE